MLVKEKFLITIKLKTFFHELFIILKAEVATGVLISFNCTANISYLQIFNQSKFTVLYTHAASCIISLTYDMPMSRSNPSVMMAWNNSFYVDLPLETNQSTNI